MLILKLAWRNIWRHRRRSLITAAAMSVGIALTISMMALQTGMFSQVFHILVEKQIGHVQIHAKAYPKKKALYDTIPNAPARIKQLSQLQPVRAVSGRLYGFALLGAGDEAGGARLTGILPAAEDHLTGLAANVVAGRYLSDKPAGELLLGHQLAEDLKVKLGDEVVVVTQAADGSMGNALLHVSGLFKTGASALDRGGAFIHLKDAEELFALEDQVHEIAILGAGREQVPELVAAVKKAVSDPALLVRSWAEISPEAKQMLEMQDASSFILIFLIFGVAGLGILNTMLMSVFERTRELGVLISLGFKPRQVIALILSETVLLTCLSAVIGVSLGLLLDAYLVLHGLDLGMQEGFSMSGIQFGSTLKGQFELSAVFITLVGLFLIAVLSSIWPAVRAARLRPVQAMQVK